MIRAGLVGAGYWGPNLGRVLAQTRRCDFLAIADLDSTRRDNMARQYPTLRATATMDEMLDAVDAVLIATPIATHYALAKKALEAGKHVFVEKPLAHRGDLAEELAILAKAKGLTLMTGHTFAYSPAVRRVKKEIETGALGDLHYISMSRVNLGLYQKDVDVIWDLAVHDIAILLYWLREMPTGGRSFGRACARAGRNDVAFLWLQFPGGTVASIEVSWLSPQKMRRTAIVGSRRMILYDDTEPSEKIKVFDRGVDFHPPETFGEFQLTYRLGDVLSPYLSNSEPLLVEVEHFFDCIETGEQPLTDGTFGANVVKVLEMVVASSWKPEAAEQAVAAQR